MGSKMCGNCRRKKILEDFSWKNHKLHTRHSICKDCHALYRKQHYIENREKYIIKARKWNSQQKQKLRAIIFGYLNNHSCLDCGESDTLVLDFDHRENKYMGVAQMVQNSYSTESVMREIKKCDVRCANCHRRKTFKERKYWKVSFRST